MSEKKSSIAHEWLARVAKACSEGPDIDIGIVGRPPPGAKVRDGVVELRDLRQLDARYTCPVCEHTSKRFWIEHGCDSCGASAGKP